MTTNVNATALPLLPCLPVRGAIPRTNLREVSCTKIKASDRSGLRMAAHRNSALHRLGVRMDRPSDMQGMPFFGSGPLWNFLAKLREAPHRQPMTPQIKPTQNGSISGATLAAREANDVDVCFRLANAAGTRMSRMAWLPAYGVKCCYQQAPPSTRTPRIRVLTSTFPPRSPAVPFPGFLARGTRRQSL